MGLATRLIPVLLIDSGYVVQTRQFKITNRIHSNCVIAAKTLGVEDADEVIILDITREDTMGSKAGFFRQFEAMADTFDIPLTAGGGVWSVAAAERLMSLGADKLCVNTGPHDNTTLIKRIADRYGSQVLAVSIDIDPGESGFGTDIIADRGSRRIGNIGAFAFAQQCVKEGAGEILLNSIQHDGMGEGYALEIFSIIADAVPVPVIYLGGVRTWEHLVEGVEHGASAVAAANIFHYKENAVREAKRYMQERGVHVRPVR